MKTAVPERTRTRATGLAVVGTTLHAILGLALFAGYVVYVPAARRMFDEYGMTLTVLARTVIRVSNWVDEYRWGLVPVIGLLGIIDFVVIGALVRSGRSSGLVPWIVGVALVFVGAGALTTYAIEIPMSKLREALAR